MKKIFVAAIMLMVYLLCTVTAFAGSSDMYTVQRVYLTDLSGNVKTNPAEASVINAEIVKNISAKTKNTIIITYYDTEGALAGFATMSATMAMGEVTEFASSFNLPAGSTIGSVKVYVWDNISAMTPISNTFTYVSGEEPAGPPVETTEFSADMYVKQSKLNAANRYDMSGKLCFGSTYYTMNGAGVNLYVNGTLISTLTNTPADNEMLDKYLSEAQGNIKLCMQQEDEGYSSIYVKAYEIAEVTNVTYKNNQTVVKFTRKTNLAQTGIYSLTVTDEEIASGKKTVTVKNKTETISLKDIRIGDIIAIACDFNTTGNAVEGDTVEVLVSGEKVTGEITGRDTEAETYIVDGTEYKVVGYYPYWALRDTYNFTLDPFGRIFSAEQAVSAKNYAIVEKWDYDEETVQLVLADGTIKSYEVESGVLPTVLNTLWSSYPMNTVKRAPWERVVEYTVDDSTGVFSAMTVVAPTSSATRVEYKKATNKLAGVTLHESTKFIDAVGYVEAAGEYKDWIMGVALDYKTFDGEALKDGNCYDAYIFKPAGSTYASFVILTHLGNVYTEDSRFAVLKKAAQLQTTSDGDIAWAAEVMYDGDITTIMFENNPNTTLAVGDAFFFEKNSEDLVDDYYVIYDHSDMQLKGHNAATVTNPITLYTAFRNFPTAGVPSDKYDSTTIKGWKFDMYDNGTAVQLFPAVISDINGNSVELARIDTTTNQINRNDSVTADGDPGVETFGIAPDAHIYINDINDATQVLASDRIYAGSLVESVLAPFEIWASSGIYDMDSTINGDYAADFLNFAIVMAVDGEIVCAYEIVQ